MINVPVSIGELIDKITILEIKIERIKDSNKKNNCQKEYNLLVDIAEKNGFVFPQLKDELKKVNEWLWDIEDILRKKEAALSFDEEFIKAVRNEYRANDQRASIKRKINTQADSGIYEEKDYVAYDQKPIE